MQQISYERLPLLLPDALHSMLSKSQSVSFGLLVYSLPQKESVVVPCALPDALQSTFFVFTSASPVPQATVPLYGSSLGLERIPRGVPDAISGYVRSSYPCSGRRSSSFL